MISDMYVGFLALMFVGPADSMALSHEINAILVAIPPNSATTDSFAEVSGLAANATAQDSSRPGQTIGNEEVRSQQKDVIKGN